MWTSRRLALLLTGIALCVAAFGVYNRFLGWMDGLPALPARYLVAAKADHPPVEPNRDDRIRQLLRQAFGDNCAEVGYSYQLRLQAQGLILAFEEFRVEDGRVKLSPLSIAVVGKVDARTGFPEINTVHCDVARVTFDRRIETLSDIGRGKVVAAEFVCDRTIPIEDRRKGTIVVMHNHGTPQADDDLIAQGPGPVFFEDHGAPQPDKPQLWTKRAIEVVDYQSRPAHVVKAQSMSVFLEPNALNAGQAPPRDRYHESPVRKVELSNVHMILAVDRPSEFLSASQPVAKSTGPPSERSLLSIRTPGSFRYDLRANRAEFAIPPEQPGLRQHVEVEVVRHQGLGNDELSCDRLELQFRRRPPTSVATNRLHHRRGAASNQPLEIDEVRATGSDVVMVSAAEKLRAHGSELIFQQSRREVTLRGAPMSAIKEGHRIEAPELFLHRPDPTRPLLAGDGPVLLGRAKGPGAVFLHDNKDKQTVEVRWSNELLMEREGQRERITLTGAPTFDDRANGQRLRGDQMRLWMMPSGKTEAAPTPSSARARLERLQVSGRVEARTPELRISDTPMLVIWFQDVPRMLTTPANRSVVLRPEPARTIVKAPAAESPSGPPTPPASSAAKRPFELSAERIDVSVLRDDARVDLERVTCRSRVRVRQDAAKPNERELEVHAQTLDLTHSVDGDVLRLGGTAHDLARVTVQEMSLHGTRIVFDQPRNRVDVDGAGRVVITTSTNLQGEKLERPADVTIQWNGRMDFIGNRVSFHDGVIAEQLNNRVFQRETNVEQNRLTCPNMDVYLDRAVSFSELHRSQTTRDRTGDDRPRIKRVVCHRGDPAPEGATVTVTQSAWKNGRQLRMQCIEAPEVTLENDRGEVVTTGPGEMRLFQLGDRLSSETVANRNESQSPAEQVFRLTRVRFNGRMRGDNRTNTATFTGQVRVWHAPTDDPNLTINPDRLPDGAFALTCQTLEVTAQAKDGRRHAEMRAEGKASIFANEFSGQADAIKYDESKKQQVIFESKTSGNPAVLYHFKVKGEPPMELMGKSILYFRQTNEFHVREGVWATGSK